MKTMNVRNIFVALLTVFVLSACGGGGGGGDSSGTSKSVESEESEGSSATTLSGVVADGYLRNARVFLDRNRNKVYDNGEPTANSESGGRFSLEVNSGEGSLYPVVVQVLAGQTIDEDDGSTVANDYLLESPVGRWSFVSPLTTLVAVEMNKNPALAEQQAALNVVTQLGVSSQISIFDNYLDTAGASAERASELALSHKAARVVAQLMGTLRSAIHQNLGGTIDDDEQTLVAYMISDQIVGKSDTIKQALDDERNSLSTLDVAALTTSIDSEINDDDLDSELLTQYQQRVDQNLESWDMQPPQMVSKSPAADANAPVDTVVSVVFDEAIDETLLGSALITVTGPSGSVSGQLSYDGEQKALSFVPDQLLAALSQYQVVVDRQLADSLGNALSDDISWSFSTVFNLTPPALPEM